MDDNSSFTKQTQKYEIDIENKDNSDKSNKYNILFSSNSYFKYFSFGISNRKRWFWKSMES